VTVLTEAEAAAALVDAIAERVIERLSKPRVLSIKHAAVYLDCTDEHVRNLIQRGELKAADIGLGEARKMLRITTEDLDRYLERKRRAA
jgi:excisionase family DNA binding protein